MKKSKTIILVLFLLSLSMSYGQVNIKKNSISTAGGSATVGNTSLTYAIGEVAMQENTQGNTHLSEGFIGPDILAAVGIEDYGELSGIGVYPNPVDSYLNIELSSAIDYEIYLYDISGKQLLNTVSTGNTRKQLDFSTYKRAVYMLIVVDRKNHKRKIIKIQKK